MLFNKKIPRSCTYCAHATKLSDEQMLCAKRGVVNAEKPCGKFRYDPCKRIPPKPKAPDFDRYSKEDFTL